MSNAQNWSAEMPTSLDQALRWRAVQQPDDRVYTFLVDGEQDAKHITYAELDRRARCVAAHLQALGLNGGRAILVYQPSLDYIIGFMGCLYAGVTAVPAYPPDPFRMERTFPRFQAIVSDARPRAILTTAMILDLAGEIFDEYPEFQGLARIASDDLTDDLAEQWRDPASTPDTLAFLQYTSGSTADPKGVMLTHGNLLHNLDLIHRAFDVQPDSCGVIWLPPYHDMGLIGGILEPLYSGLSVVLMSPLDFLQRPLRWLTAITRYSATISGGPNFAYDLCVRKVTEAQKAALDLSHWRVAFNGAEPVRKDTIERFSTAFASCGFRKEAFYPCYGLAEATLMVSGGTASQAPAYCAVSAGQLNRGRVTSVAEEAADAITLVGCGRTLDAQEIAIVDPETLARCLPGQVGEIWVAGDSVAQGYWQRPTDSADTFQARLDGSERRFLRTGDLGFFCDDELYIAGRIKDLIIIDGKNHYPQDIELTVEGCHPAVRPGCTAAFSVADGGEERLVVVTEVAKGYRPVPADAPAAPDGPKTIDVTTVTAAIRRAVAQRHDLRVRDVALLKPGAIPKTSSGKIQRRATRAAYLDGGLELWSA